MEFSIIEKHFLQVQEQDKSEPETDANEDLNNIRCYMLNSLVEIFHVLCKSNHLNWRLPQQQQQQVDRTDLNENLLILNLNPLKKSGKDVNQNLRRLAQYSSLLINSLTTLRIKSSATKSEDTLGQLIYKLKSIKSFIEPFTVMSDLKANETVRSLAMSSSFYCQLSFLNQAIDFFKKTYDKNLNLFFLKQYYLSYLTISNSQNLAMITPKITSDYLNPTITVLNLFNNIIQDMSPLATSDLTTNLVKYALNADVHFRAKRLLGHLIGRNVHGMCLGLLDKLSDYLLFYSDSTEKSAFSTRCLSNQQIELLVNVIEPGIRLIRTILKSLMRTHKFKDTSALGILFRFSGAFDHCVRFSLKKAQPQLGRLQERANAVHKLLLEIFILFTGKLII